MDSLLESSQYAFPRSTRRAPTASLDFSEVGSVTAPSSVCRGGVDRTVELADDEVQMLTELADTLLARLVADYEVHVRASCGNNNLTSGVDKKRWKSLKKREQLTVYKERSSDPTTLLPTSSKPQRTVPHVLLVGSLPGRVADALYGLSSATSLAMKFRSAYSTDASIVDADVLATIAGPSVEAPFRFLGLKYHVYQHRGSAIKKRDVVFLEATGTTLLSNGDSVGYHIVHSVDVHARLQAHAASKEPVVRALTSMGHLFHQQTCSNRATEILDVYMRGYYDPRGDMLQFVAIHVAAEQLLQTATGSVECAQLRKLSFAAQQSTHARRRRQTTAALHCSDDDGADDAALLLLDMHAAARDVDAEREQRDDRKRLQTCVVCLRNCYKVLQRSGAACTICTRVVCARCVVRKTLCFTRVDDLEVEEEASARSRARMDLHNAADDDDRSDGGRSRRSTRTVQSMASALSTAPTRVQQAIVHKALRFCVPCIVLAHAQSATAVAVDELRAQQARSAVAAMHSNRRTGVVPTPRQVLARNVASERRPTRTGSVQYHASLIGHSSSSNSTPAARARRTSRPKAFSTSSTASSTTSSVVLYDESSCATASGA